MSSSSMRQYYHNHKNNSYYYYYYYYYYYHLQELHSNLRLDWSWATNLPSGSMSEMRRKPARWKVRM